MLFRSGGVPTPDDVTVLAGMAGADGLLVLFAAHRRLEDAEPAGQSSAAATVLRALQTEVPRRAVKSATDFEPLVPQLEAMLAHRQPVLRWWAAECLVRGLGAVGLRKVLDGLPSDDHWRSPDATQRAAVVRFAREVVAPLDKAEIQPLLLAALARKGPKIGRAHV